MEHGLVLNIQRYCIHDGPGIRTTVFLKGCPLGCWWCHNPESQLAEREIRVIESRCIACGRCAAACPQGLDRSAPFEPTACTRCGACADACPTGARQMQGRRMTAHEVLEELLRDRIFYDDSGGGMTLSGGEPLMQAPFALELLRDCRSQALHTAVDTCGYVPRKSLLAVAPFVDLFLYDVKAVDDVLHRQHTGVSNTMILENLRALSEIHDQIWIRVPIVPGFNDQAEELEAISQFVASLPNIRQVNLLPYHAWGTHKAIRNTHAANRDPGLALPKEKLDFAVELFRAEGLRTLAGG